MNTLDWKWTQVRARMPARQSDSSYQVYGATACYGIGWYSAKEQSWVVTAEPNMFEGVLVPME